MKRKRKKKKKKKKNPGNLDGPQTDPSQIQGEETCAQHPTSNQTFYIHTSKHHFTKTG